jgi:two-component system, NtrC family, response regulator
MTQTAPAKILIVEDDSDVCWAVTRIVAKMGYEPVAAARGEEASELIRSNRFRLALVDAKLPDVEGNELAARLKACQPDLPVVLFSGYFYPDDPWVREWIGSGLIHGFVSKPFELSEISEILAAAIDTDDS